jgi:hypothetical protein
VRAITYSVRSAKGPFHNISAGATHLHHYLWGIAMPSAVAVHGADEDRRHPAVTFSYDAGLALIADEFALLLDLKDVYWAASGRTPYVHFESPPCPGVLKKIDEYAQRYGTTPAIDISPL